MNCDVCTEPEAKYKCPGCTVSTCSLACSKEHKAKTSCTGQRNRVGFIPRSKFDETSVNNDYNFLTALERDLDNAARLNEHNPGGRNANQARAFVKRAQDVGQVTVILAPRGMKRSKMNKSAWVPKKGEISWTVEWLFDGTVRKVSDRVLESTMLRDAIAFYMGKMKETEASFQQIEIQDLFFLLKNESQRGSQPVYSRLDIEKSLAEALRFRTIVEFPTIHIYTQLPEGLKLERGYDLVQPVTTTLMTEHSRPNVVTPGNDFISFANDSDEEPAKAPLSTFGLPVLDFDDLEVPAD